MRGIVSLVVFLVVSLAAGWIGSRFLPGAWYESLVKPSWTPPSSVFGPVWTLLYIMMGIAAWLVWRRRKVARVTTPLFLFAVQLILNGMWSYIFFGRQQPAVAFLEIVVLWIAVLLTLIGFWRIRRTAGAMMLPYCLWVSFAAVLNFQLWRLNT
jgi:tryptophan-rich sensory protein